MTSKKALVCWAVGIVMLQARAQLPLQDGRAVATYFSDMNIDPAEHRVAIFDTRDPMMVPGPCNSAVTFARGAGTAPDWTRLNLGSVFGVALDRKRNIFVSATRIYGGCDNYTSSYGAVYRIEGGIGGAAQFAARGTVNLFCDLPNQTALGSAGEGLGNICFDRVHNQFFVSNFDDGMIYSIPNLAVLPVPVSSCSVYDHGATLIPAENDNASIGYTQRRRRVWAVQMQRNRLFYSVWRNDEGYSVAPSTPLAERTVANEIWSVAVHPMTGLCLPLTRRLELTMPKYEWQDWSNPVSDISFSPFGDRAFFAERSIYGDCGFAAHESRLLEYCFTARANGPWEWCASPINTLRVGEYDVNSNACGGVSVDITGRPWASGDALNWNTPCGSGSTTTFPKIYGYQGFPGSGIRRRRR
jgi:hypothetical protein